MSLLLWIVFLDSHPLAYMLNPCSCALRYWLMYEISHLSLTEILSLLLYHIDLTAAVSRCYVVFIALQHLMDWVDFVGQKSKSLTFQVLLSGSSVFNLFSQVMFGEVTAVFHVFSKTCVNRFYFVNK